ncbi:unannotated protein [freshwater metagenome]|uniref:Unannotated protein n=1 Tax=freshwater metagenome TaxID=449393 RepID=A0A6J5YES3_9ZZZZ
MGILGPAHDCRGGTISHTGAVEHTERARHLRCLLDLLCADLLAELSTGVAGAVVMVFCRDMCEHTAHGVVVHAELVAIGRHDHGEHGRSGEGACSAVVGDRERIESLIAGVLDLLRTDDHDEVVGAGGNGVGGLTQRFRAGGAIVLNARDRLVLQLQRTGERDAAHGALGGSEPVGVNVVLGDASRGVGLIGCIDHEIVEALAPVLDEGRAAHADNSDAVANSMTSHGSASPSRSSCECHLR